MRTENTVSVRDPEVAPAVDRAYPKLTVEICSSGGATIVSCAGRLVYGDEANNLCAALGDILPAARRVIVDLAGLESIDSAGLGELVLLQMWAEAAGYELKFANPNRWIQQLLELTNLTSLFDIYPSLTDAVAATRNSFDNMVHHENS